MQDLEEGSRGPKRFLFHNLKILSMFLLQPALAEIFLASLVQCRHLSATFSGNYPTSCKARIGNVVHGAPASRVRKFSGVPFHDVIPLLLVHVLVR